MKITDDNVKTMAVIGTTGAVAGWGFEAVRQQNLKTPNKADKFIENTLSPKLRDKYSYIKSGFAENAAEALKSSAKRTARKLRAVSAVAGAMLFASVYVVSKYIGKIFNKKENSSDSSVVNSDVIDVTPEEIISPDDSTSYDYDYDDDFNEDPIEEL